MPKKTEREDPLGFSNIHFVAKLEKNERGTLVSPGNVCYALKKENLFGLVPWANRWNFVELLVEPF